MKESFRKTFWIFLVLVLVQACSCGLPGLLSTATPEVIAPSVPATQIPAAATSTPVLPAPAGVYPPPFATYHEAAVSLPQTFNGGGYSLPLDLNKVQGLDLVTLTAAQRALLAQNGFAVATPVPAARVTLSCRPFRLLTTWPAAMAGAAIPPATTLLAVPANPALGE